MKNLWLVFAWTSFTTLILLANGIGASYFLQRNRQLVNVIGPVNETSITTSVSNPNQPLGEVKGVSTEVQSGDARIPLVANFLRRHESPLDPDDFSKKLVAIADHYNIDFRLLPAISMQESNLCKKIPEGTYNCLGFGIHSRGTLAFDSYEAAFDRAGRELKKNYIDQGRTTPEQIMEKYTPHSNGSWADSVNQWMAEMRFDDRGKGRDSQVDANVLEFTNQATPSAKSH